MFGGCETCTIEVSWRREAEGGLRMMRLSSGCLWRRRSLSSASTIPEPLVTFLCLRITTGPLGGIQNVAKVKSARELIADHLAGKKLMRRIDQVSTRLCFLGFLISPKMRAHTHSLTIVGSFGCWVLCLQFRIPAVCGWWLACERDQTSITLVHD